jgi:hypothetical protein
MKFLIYTCLVVIIALNLSCQKRSTSFGKVNSVTGDVAVFSTKNNKWNPVEKSNIIHFGDTLQTNKGSAEIGFKNKSKLTLEPNTKVVILDSVDKKNSYIFPIVFSGGILSEVKHQHPNDFIYIVYTPVAYAQAKGSHFYVSHLPSSNTSNIQVFDGDVIVYNTTDFSEPVQLSPGFTTTVINSNAPGKPVKLKYKQFRRIGYMFTPEICEHYEVVFGFPVVPIPVQFPVFVSAPVEVNEEEPIESVEPDNYEPEPQPDHNEHGRRSNVSVNVNIDGQLPFLPVPVPLPGGPIPRHGFHPGPGFAPPLPMPFPPGPHRRSFNNCDDQNRQRDDWNRQRDEQNRQRDEQNRQRDEQNRQQAPTHRLPPPPPPHPPVPFPVPGHHMPNPFKH